jgi:integrase
VESLRRHRVKQTAERLKAPVWQQPELVLASEVGTPLEPQHITTRHFRPLLRRAGLPELRFHDIRHTCATLLLARGTHPSYVQRLLGHASVRMTLDRYSHWMPSMGQVAANEMDAALG